MRPGTLAERRRLYLLARLLVKRRYREHLTVEVVAKTLATSPRQLQRAYVQFGDSTFHDDLTMRRMVAAAELLSQPSILVRDVARFVGYRQPSHFARAFRRRYGVSPGAFRADLCKARHTRREVLRSITTPRSVPSHPPSLPLHFWVMARFEATITETIVQMETPADNEPTPTVRSVY
jgi:AraC family transcriptional regulator of adaptative response / methylphosphotriester-DNA alkyltransferase methyltransferase